MINLIRWNHLPWTPFTDPLKQWDVLPTFLVIEYCCIMLTIASLIHAVKNGENHLLIWIASFITGTANDVFFMALPLVDNFWQAQATIMLTPRLPLYICCVYNLFLYYSTTSSWRLGFENPIAEAAVTGFLALFIYFPYDFIGVKHLWWTWHTTDPCIRNRLMGVPIGSSMWILLFSACFSMILYICRGKLKMNTMSTLLVSALTTTPLMMVFMTLIQLISLEQNGVPSVRGLFLCVFIFAAIIIIYSLLLIDTSKSYKWIVHKSLTKCDPLLGVCLIIYYILLLAMGFYGQPEKMVSVGIHQAFGPCGVTVHDFTGLSRDQYVCPNNIPREWNISCNEVIKEPFFGNDTIEWYKICGTPHSNESLWKNMLTIQCIVPIVIFFLVLIFIPIRSHGRRKVKER